MLALTILLFLGLNRDFAGLKNFYWFSGTAIFILTVGSWYGGALWQGGPAFFLRQIINENIGTARGTWGHYQPIYYFVPVFFYNLAPWSFFSFPIAFFFFRRRHTLGEDGILFPLAWFVAVFLFFSIALGKRAVYILPLFPAFALLLGGWWAMGLKDNFKADWLTTAINYVLAVSIFLVVVAVGLFISGMDRRLPLPRKTGIIGDLLDVLTPPAPLVSVCLTAGGIAALVMIVFVRRKKWQELFVAPVVLAAAATLIMKSLYFPAIASIRTLKPFGARLQQSIAVQAPLLFYDAFDAGTIFYSRRHIASYFDKANEITPPFFLLMWEKDWEKLHHQNNLEMMDVSEGRGPVGKNRLVLVKASKRLPVLDAHSESETIRQELEGSAQ